MEKEIVREILKVIESINWKLELEFVAKKFNLRIESIEGIVEDLIFLGLIKIVFGVKNQNYAHIISYKLTTEGEEFLRN